MHCERMMLAVVQGTRLWWRKRMSQMQRKRPVRQFEAMPDVDAWLDERRQRHGEKIRAIINGALRREMRRQELCEQHVRLSATSVMQEG